MLVQTLTSFECIELINLAVLCVASVLPRSLVQVWKCPDSYVPPVGHRHESKSPAVVLCREGPVARPSEPCSPLRRKAVSRPRRAAFQWWIQ